MLKNKGFSFLEAILVIAILGILIGMMVPLMADFSRRRDVDVSALKLLQDLRQAHQFSRVLRDSYEYYGINFLSGLGENGDRIGYRIVRYAPANLTPPINWTLMQDSSGKTVTMTIIKSSSSADNPEFLEDTFFSERVDIDDLTSEIIVGDTIVFTPQGSATTDGQNLLPADEDQITLTGRNFSRTISISALTGYVKIE